MSDEDTRGCALAPQPAPYSQPLAPPAPDLWASAAPEWAMQSVVTDLRRVRAERDAAIRERDAAVALLRELAATSGEVDGDLGAYCFHCVGENGSHSDACLWLRALALVATVAR